MPRVLTKKQQTEQRLEELRRFEAQVLAEAHPDEYPEGGKWKDEVNVAAAKRKANDMITSGARLDGLPMVSTLFGDPNEAAARLARHRERQSLEKRALSTSGGGSTFVGPGAYDADRFAVAARESAKLSQVLPILPLPPTGMQVLIPRLATGASTAIQIAEGNAESATDPTDARTPNPIGTIAGEVVVSQQLLDRSDPAAFDAVIDEELGRAYGQALDKQLLSGTGANGQLLGLSTVTGISATAYTDGSPTQQEALVQIFTNAAAVAEALGSAPTHVLMRPKRHFWFLNQRDSALFGPSNPIQWPGQVVEVPAIPNNEGAGTNQDAIYVITASELPIYLSDPTFEVLVDWSGGADVLRARIRVRAYASSSFTRRPEAIGKVSGTGFVPAAFS